MDDDVETGPRDRPVEGESGGMSRRTMLRRSALAGGALLWATPVVQTLGTGSAYANFRGSGQPGGCICTEKIVAIAPVACRALTGTKHRISTSGKIVTLEALTGGSCGDRLHCSPEQETVFWTVVTAVGCELLSQSGKECQVEVTAYPANIVLQVQSTLTCLGGRSNRKSCSDTVVHKVCFSQVTGSESQRCGRFEPHRNQAHGTQKCH